MSVGKKSNSKVINNHKYIKDESIDDILMEGQFAEMANEDSTNQNLKDLKGIYDGSQDSLTYKRRVVK